MTFPESAMSLIQEKGVAGLGGHDGCACSSFQVFYANVEIACHKSGDGPRIFVSSASMDYDKTDLHEIAELVKADVAESTTMTFEIVLNDETYDGRTAWRKAHR